MMAPFPSLDMDSKCLVHTSRVVARGAAAVLTDNRRQARQPG